MQINESIPMPEAFGARQKKKTNMKQIPANTSNQGFRLSWPLHAPQLGK